MKRHRDFAILGCLATVHGVAAPTTPEQHSGAKGDGVTDDTPAIQKTIEAAAANPGRRSHLPQRDLPPQFDVPEHAPVGTLQPGEAEPGEARDPQEHDQRLPRKLYIELKLHPETVLEEDEKR